MKKIIAALMAMLFVLSLTSCGNKNEEEYKKLSGAVDYVSNKLDMIIELLDERSYQGVDGFVPGDNGFVDNGDASSSDAATPDGANNGGSSSSSSNASSSSSQNSSSSQQSSTGNSTSEIVAKYVSAAKATDKNVKVTIKKTLKDLNGGSGFVGAVISALKDKAKQVLDEKSGTGTGVRGNLDLITVNDFTKVSATTSGDFTTVTLIVKDYTATATGRGNEGSVGHVIGVLDTLSEATEPMGMEAVGDTSNVRLKYTNAKVVAKINNKTNKIVSATWEYDVDVTIPDNKVKFSGITIHLKDANVVIGYKAVL